MPWRAVETNFAIAPEFLLGVSTTSRYLGTTSGRLPHLTQVASSRANGAGTQKAGVYYAAIIAKETIVSNSDIIYADEVASLLRRSLDTIRYWDRIGKVLPPSYKLGRRKYWRRSEIEALLGT